MHFSVIAVALAATLATAPGAPSRTALPAADTIVVLDDIGSIRRFPRPPRRIVSLVPALTEVVYALDAGDRMVGRSRWDDVPAEVRGVPSVGDALRPSAEAVVERDPDLVLLVGGADNRRSVDELERLGVPVLVVRVNTLEDLFRNVERLGVLLGREARAAALRNGIEAKLEAVRRATDTLETPGVYYDVAWPPPYTAGSGSYLDTLVSVAGGRNVFGDIAAPSPRVSLEAILARDPDVILLPTDPTGNRPPPARRPGWDSLRAVREGRVVRVDAGLLHRLGPRVGMAARHLARALHPAAFLPDSAPAPGRP